MRPPVASLESVKEMIVAYCERFDRPVGVVEISNYLGSDWPLDKVVELTEAMVENRDLRLAVPEEVAIHNVDGFRVGVRRHRPKSVRHLPLAEVTERARAGPPPQSGEGPEGS